MNSFKKTKKIHYKSTPRQFQTDHEEYLAYRNAVWDYVVEHSDIVSGGAIFVKFHTNDRGQFESHVESRMKFNYHRGDPMLKQAEMQRRKDKVAEVARRNTAQFEKKKIEVEKKLLELETQIVVDSPFKKIYVGIKNWFNRKKK